MKNYFIAIAALGIMAMSCKKDRTCSCTVTTDGTTTTHTQTAGLAIAGLPAILPATDTTTSQPLHSVNTLNTTYPKVSKSSIRANCFSKSEESIDQTSTNTSPGIFTITTTDTGAKTYACTID
jgi:hypothetical protein